MVSTIEKPSEVCDLQPQRHHTTRAPPDAEGGVQGGPEGGLPPGARQPAQGEAADAAQVVYEEGGQLEANLLGDLPPTDDSNR